MSDKTCECDDTECTIPAGRCSLCAQPCMATGPHTEICGKCVVAVRAFYDLECRTTPSPDGEAGPDPDGPGWFLIDECEDGSGVIVRDDGQDVFPSDEDAAQHVAARLASRALDDDEHTPVVPMLSTAAGENIRAMLAAAFPGVPPTVTVTRLLDEHAEMQNQQEARRLRLSDRARMSHALRELAARERQAAAEVTDARTRAQLEHQAEHAAALADEIQDATSLLVLK